MDTLILITMFICALLVGILTIAAIFLVYDEVVLRLRLRNIKRDVNENDDRS